MIESWSPGQNAAQYFREFSRAAIRWDHAAGGALRFLVFGNPSEEEEPFTQRELGLVRAGLRDLGLEVCAFERYEPGVPPGSWALVVRPQEPPRDGRAAWALEVRLNALVWQARFEAQPLPPRGPGGHKGRRSPQAGRGPGKAARAGRDLRPGRR